jgi:hypothetical protein
MELKDWLNSINFNKKDLTVDEPECIKKYPPYIVNKCLSGSMDCIMYANEMNLHHHLDKDMQYKFYLNTVRKQKRFSPWLKKEKINDLEIVKRYYGYSNDKAFQALKILNNEQIEFIKSKLEVGGTR